MYAIKKADDNTPIPQMAMLGYFGVEPILGIVDVSMGFSLLPETCHGS